MNWQALVKRLKDEGFDGDVKSLDAVKAFLDDMYGGVVEVSGKALDIDELHSEAYPPRPALDVSKDAEDMRVEAIIKATRDDERAAMLAAGIGSTKVNRDHSEEIEAVSVKSERWEDSPALTYSEFSDSTLGFGMFLHDVKKAAYARQSGRQAPDRLLKANEYLTKGTGTGMNMSTDAEGGFLVAPEHQSEVLRKAHDTGMVFSRARPFSLTSKQATVPYIVESSRVDGSRHGGVRGYWTGEGATLTASAPKGGKLTLTAHKLTTLGYATEELEEDGDVGAITLLGELFPEEIAFKMDDAFINGTGAGQPLGVLNANCTVSVAKETGQAASTVVFENVSKMYSRMWGRSRANAVWFINQDIEPQLFTMSLSVGTGGLPVYMPADGAAGTPFGRLMGRPVIPVEACATLGTVGDIILADMSQYLYAQRRGMTSAQSIHVQFTTDEVAFKTTMRGDGQPWWQAALTPYKGSNTQSPFVTLATRA
jgi:HK97 family phage major capsid protein